MWGWLCLLCFICNAVYCLPVEEYELAVISSSVPNQDLDLAPIKASDDEYEHVIANHTQSRSWQRRFSTFLSKQQKRLRAYREEQQILQELHSLTAEDRLYWHNALSNAYQVKSILFREKAVSDCDICYEEKHLVEFSCRHSFCVGCRQQWQSTTCPFCRQELVLVSHYTPSPFATLTHYLKLIDNLQQLIAIVFQPEIGYSLALDPYNWDSIDDRVYTIFHFPFTEALMNWIIWFILGSRITLTEEDRIASKRFAWKQEYLKHRKQVSETLVDWCEYRYAKLVIESRVTNLVFKAIHYCDAFIASLEIEKK